MERKLYRSRSDRKLFGVIGGFAKYFNVDATILRIIYVLLSIFVIGCPIIIYLIVALIIPEEPENTEYQQANYEPVDNDSDF